jgi:hypothetical protein
MSSQPLLCEALRVQTIRSLIDETIMLTELGVKR